MYLQPGAVYFTNGPKCETLELWHADATRLVWRPFTWMNRWLMLVIGSEIGDIGGNVADTPRESKKGMPASPANVQESTFSDDR